MADKQKRERYAALVRLEVWLEPVMIALAFVWLGLLVWEVSVGLTPLISTLGILLWSIFIVDFALRLFLAPDKSRFLTKNWLVILSLLVPAMRVFRVLRALRLLRLARTARGLQVVRVVGAFNRGMRAIRRTMGKRGFGYAALLTLLVVVTGAAGMFAFEQAHDGNPGGFQNYWDAFWWTAMMTTTSGSGYWPVSAEGRFITYLIALYGFSVFGYLAATLASAFVDQDRKDEPDRALDLLRGEIAELREQLRESGLRGRASLE